jgi:hypothetical protein
MAPKKKMSKKVSRSSIHANQLDVNSLRIQIDIKATEDETAEYSAWSVISQEISEWHYVCRSGRPYCWSDEARRKRTRKKLRFENDFEQEFRSGDGSREMMEERGSDSSEELLEKEEDLNTMAHMVAVQLLGSCFTLPNESAQMHPKSVVPGVYSNKIVSDPQMISSLRLHSQYRYSPSFGHEARNPSPVQLWHGLYDGTPSPPAETLEVIPWESANDDFNYGKGKNRRVPDNSEVSNSSFAIDNEDYVPRRNTIDRDINAVTKAWYRRNSLRQAVSRSLTLPVLPEDGKVFGIGRGRSKNARKRTEDMMASPDESTQSSTRASWGSIKQPRESGFRLQPVLRSEPHPVFVQPVKELVVKRWRTFRRKLSAVPHSPHHISSPRERMSEASESGRSTMSDDGRLRRKRAQEREEIHSSFDSGPHNTSPASGYSPAEKERRLSRPYWEESEGGSCRSKLGKGTVSGSEECTTHYNTPCSVFLTPEGIQRMTWLTSAKASPTQELPDSLAVEAAAALIVNNHVDHLHVRTDAATPSTPLQPPPTPIINYTAGYPSTPGSVIGLPPTLSSSKVAAKGKASNTAEFQLRTMQAPPTFQSSTMRIPKGRRRKSCLSEVCTPEDFSRRSSPNPDGSERNVSSAAGSALATPVEDSLPSMFLSNDPTHPIPKDLLGSRNKTTTPPTITSRPRLQRMSTSGTQVFSPNADGIEVDGLPVGPGHEMWSGCRERGERSYL